jgi:hypothetical protein
MPMRSEGETGYCSPRCLNWDFFGVPALKESDFIKEVRRNQALTETPDGWERPPAYPELGARFEKEITEALALLKNTCNSLRTISQDDG